VSSERWRVKPRCGSLEAAQTHDIGQFLVETADRADDLGAEDPNDRVGLGREHLADQQAGADQVQAVGREVFDGARVSRGGLDYFG
jgi:hypothetical protein